MLKMAASLLLILGGAGIGYARSREITEREKNLEILLQILFFLKGEIRCGNSSLPDAFREIAAKISGFFGTILRDAAQEMEDTGGKNLEEIMEFCIQRNFYQGNPGGSQRKEDISARRVRQSWKCSAPSDRRQCLLPISVYSPSARDYNLCERF